MDNQHKKIQGYRDLSQEEIDLMNTVKSKAEEVKILLKQIRALRDEEYDKVAGYKDVGLIIESYRCLSLAQNNLQTGFMWLVRSIALPQSF